MAGAGYKLFNTGDVLTAAQVNTYLMEQTTMVFADAAARTAALSGVVAEGMISYLKSTKQVEVYNGSAWVASDDPNAIQNTIVDAKGDLITATANDTPARLAVGNNGDTLVANDSVSTGLSWNPSMAGGKNQIINGNFDIWQRGTTFTGIANGAYCADRFFIQFDGTGVRTISRQDFTPGTAPASPYESQYFLRINQTTAGTGGGYQSFTTRIEDVRTFAGQSATISFYAKADSARQITARWVQYFGATGSATTYTTFTTPTLTTGWQKYTATITVPSVSGKTIASDAFGQLEFNLPVNTTFTIDFSLIQFEVGSVATRFTRAGGTLAGELAACQRYYYRQSVSTNQAVAATGGCVTTTIADSPVIFPVTMRTAPSTSIEVGSLRWYNYGDGSLYSSGTFTLVNPSTYNAVLRYTHGSGVFTTGQSGLAVSSGGSGFLGISAEL